MFSLSYKGWPRTSRPPWWSRFPRPTGKYDIKTSCNILFNKNHFDQTCFCVLVGFFRWNERREGRSGRSRQTSKCLSLLTTLNIITGENKIYGCWWWFRIIQSKSTGLWSFYSRSEKAPQTGNESDSAKEKKMDRIWKSLNITFCLFLPSHRESQAKTETWACQEALWVPPTNNTKSSDSESLLNCLIYTYNCLWLTGTQRRTRPAGSSGQGWRKSKFPLSIWLAKLYSTS